MMKKILVLSSILVSVFLAAHNLYAQESAIDYKQLIDKCGEAIKQTKSYNIEMEAKSSFTINSQENKDNSAKLNITFVSPDRFKVAQVINEGTNENLWDGWIVIGSDCNGTYEIWINKNDYLPLKQSSEISYYSNEQNKGTVSTSINYSSYNDDKIKIDKPVLGSKVF